MKILLYSAAALFSLLAILIGSARAQDQVMPSVGQEAPGFRLPSQDGSPISLSSYRGKWVVLYFYPKDMTPGCTIEAHNFERDRALYEASNAVILGVSLDTAASHQQFCTKESLSFRLLSDTDHTVIDQYGSLASFAGIKVAARNTFLIDPQGKIAQIWTKVSPSTHSNEVLAALHSLAPH